MQKAATLGLYWPAACAKDLLRDGGFDLMGTEVIDTRPDIGIMTPEEVARFLRKSTGWVYRNWEILGGRKLGGSLFFPSKEDLYERLFSQGQGVEVRLHPQRDPVHGNLVQNQNSGKTGRVKKKGGDTNPKPQTEEPMTRTDMAFLDLVNLRLDYVKAYNSDAALHRPCLSGQKVGTHVGTSKLQRDHGRDDPGLFDQAVPTDLGLHGKQGFKAAKSPFQLCHASDPKMDGNKSHSWDRLLSGGKAFEIRTAERGCA